MTTNDGPAVRRKLRQMTAEGRMTINEARRANDQPSLKVQLAKQRSE